MTGTGIMDRIKSLLAEGNSSAEVIAMDFKPTTVYKAQRQMVEGGKVSHSSGNGVSTKDQQSPAKGQAEYQKPMTPRVHELPDPEVEAHAEVVQLKIDLRKAQLEKAIAEVKAPIEVEGRLAKLEERTREIESTLEAVLESYYTWLRVRSS